MISSKRHMGNSNQSANQRAFFIIAFYGSKNFHREKLHIIGRELGAYLLGNLSWHSCHIFLTKEQEFLF
jgi:hypothetical protein